MSKPQAHMTVRRVSDGSSVIEIHGEVTSFAEEALMQAYNQAIGQGPTQLLLDFSRLEYMNSGGIGLLVTLLIRANRQGHRLAAFGLSDHYRQIFQLTRLNEAISIYPSEVEALAAV
jgi:anti-anti-sigma factor